MAVFVYYLGKFFEAIAIVLLLVALIYGLSTGDIRTEVRYFFIGLVLFLIGRGLERWSGRGGA